MSNLTTSGKFSIVIFLMITLLTCCLGKTEKEKRDKKYKDKIETLEYKRGDKHVDHYESYAQKKRKDVPKLKVETDSNGVRKLYKCDSTGKRKEPMQLRGMSSHGLQWSGRASITKHNIKEILKKDWGCNLFRIAVHINEEGGYFCNPGRTHRFLDEIVEWCEDVGIYCLIDCYISKPGNPNDTIYRSYKMDTVIFSKERHKAGQKSSPNNTIDLAGSFFTYCAQRYKDKTNVIYGLCAQPNGIKADYNDLRITWQYHIRPYCEDMIEIIQGIDPEKVIICGTPHYSTRPQDVISNEPQNRFTGKKYDNLMYALQVCAGSNLPEFNKFKSSKDSLELSGVLEQIPIFATTFMTTDQTGHSNFNIKESDKWLKFFYDNNISWCNWSFASIDDGGECCVLKWNSGCLPTDSISLRDSILTESGKYIRKKLIEFSSSGKKSKITKYNFTIEGNISLEKK